MIDQKLHKKWEDRLQRLGLGVDQPMTDNSDGELEQATSMPSLRGDKHPDHARLRTKIDSNDQFMEGGFGIKSIRSLEREIPEWTLNNKEVTRFLLSVFPKLSLAEPKNKKEAKVRARRVQKAGRWARVIHLYYRMQLPRQVVAKEMGMNPNTVKMTIRNITAARKVYDTSPAASVVLEKKGDEAK